MKLKLAFVLSVAVLAGCASPTVVQSVKPNDNTLSCAQLQNEFNEAEQFKKDADSEKGVTGGNALRLLFWPAIIKTQMNANEAIAAADNRKVHIANLMSQKNCPTPVSAALAATAPATAASAPAK
jgi:outer membrane murein-binding lipoprotein Lpp